MSHYNNESTMKHLILALLMLAIALTSPAGAAVQVKGVKFGDTFEVAGQTLQLNGAGVRVKLVFDVYAASMYLSHKQTSTQGVLTQNGPKSVQAVLLRDLSAEDFVSAMIKGFKANNSEADVAKFKGRLDALEAMMMTIGTAHKGAAVHIDFVPGAGTRIMVDGQQKGPDIVGEDFYQALLKIWLGDKPVDSDLKSALLKGD
jgi:Chalcone isomerase-like